MITPMDIHNKTFSKGLRGYSEEEVNDFLRQIVTDYEQIYREHREMEEQMDQMKTKLANYEKISETMTNTLQLAKDTAENVKKNAKRNAEILIANAHAEGNRQVREAENMIRTEGNMKTYVGKIRRDLQLALAAIDALDRMEAPKVAGFPPVGEKKEETPAPEAEAVETAETAEASETAESAETAETTEAAEAPEAETPAEDAESAEEAPAEEEKKE